MPVVTQALLQALGTEQRADPSPALTDHALAGKGRQKESVQVSVDRCVQGEEVGSRGAGVWSEKPPCDSAFVQRPECSE